MSQPVGRYDGLHRRRTPRLNVRSAGGKQTVQIPTMTPSAQLRCATKGVKRKIGPNDNNSGYTKVPAIADQSKDTKEGIIKLLTENQDCPDYPTDTSSQILLFQHTENSTEGETALLWNGKDWSPIPAEELYDANMCTEFESSLDLSLSQSHQFQTLTGGEVSTVVATDNPCEDTLSDTETTQQPEHNTDGRAHDDDVIEEQFSETEGTGGYSNFSSDGETGNQSSVDENSAGEIEMNCSTQSDDMNAAVTGVDENSEDSEEEKDKKTRLAKVLRTSFNTFKQQCSLEAKKGPHHFQERESYLPKFTSELARVLQFGTRREIANQVDNVVAEIVDEMALVEGSGNPRYYKKLQANLVGAYPRLNCAPFRNACRKKDHKKKRRKKKKNTEEKEEEEEEKEIPLELLSEDSEEEPPLKVEKGAPRRSSTTRDCLKPLMKPLSKGNRGARRKHKGRVVIQEIVSSWSTSGKRKPIANCRWTRASMLQRFDEEITLIVPKIRSIGSEDEDPKYDFLGAYRNTWPLRTAVLECASGKLDDILSTYPLLMHKKYMDVEAELYLGSEDKLKQYLVNVGATWRAIAALDSTKSAEQNFREYVAVSGEEIVRYIHPEKLAYLTIKDSWPVVLVTTEAGRNLQVILRYKHYSCLDFSSIEEALGYLVLLMCMFDLPVKGRPRTLIILEACFLGYRAQKMRQSDVLLVERLKQLWDEEDKSEDPADGRTTELEETVVVQVAGTD